MNRPADQPTHDAEAFLAATAHLWESGDVPEGLKMDNEAEKPQTGPQLGAVPCCATIYRLRLSHPRWNRDTYTKWQSSPDFTTALKRAEELGVTATVESHNSKDHKH